MILSEVSQVTFQNQLLKVKKSQVRIADNIKRERNTLKLHKPLFNGVSLGIPCHFADFPLPCVPCSCVLISLLEVFIYFSPAAAFPH